MRLLLQRGRVRKQDSHHAAWVSRAVRSVRAGRDGAHLFDLCGSELHVRCAEVFFQTLNSRMSHHN